MPKDIRISIVEDDPFARDLMVLLLTRDWRTQVVAEMDSRKIWARPSKAFDNGADVIVIDTEVPGAPEAPLQLAEMASKLPEAPVMLYTATRLHEGFFSRLAHQACGGFLLKGEILYALATAITLAARDRFVVTPGLLPLAADLNGGRELVVLDGRTRVAPFTPRETEMLRLGIIFNLSVRDMADELSVTPGWISEMISTIYRKLGVREILSGETPLEGVFEDEAVLARVREIVREAQPAHGSKRFPKAPWMDTLAFHLLTTPAVVEGGAG